MTDHDWPIARIVPVRPADRVVVQAAVKPFATIRRRRYAPPGWTVSSTEILLEERQGR